MKCSTFLIAALFTTVVATAQTTDTEEEYIPVEVRGATPNKLEGTWVLQSGLKNISKERLKELEEKKQQLVKDERKDKQVTTKTKKDGTTITEVVYEVNATPEKQITPTQSSKLHKPQPPSINFYGVNETFSGFTGCNKFAGRFKVSGNNLKLTDANPSTRMACIGEYDEKEFLDKITKVNNFRATNNKLELLAGNEVLLVFVKK